MKTHRQELQAIGRRIRNRRNELNLSREELARRVDLEDVDLFKLEQGAGNASLLLLCQLAAALQTGLGSLLENLPFQELGKNLRQPQAAVVDADDLSFSCGGNWRTEPDAIRKFRLQHGMTQKELGDLCGVSASAIHQWESGRTLSGSSAIVMRNLIEGGESISLSRHEESLLDEAVRRGGFANRRDFLASALLGIIRDGRSVFPEAGEAPPFHVSQPIPAPHLQPVTSR